MINIVISHALSRKKAVFRRSITIWVDDNAAYEKRNVCDQDLRLLRDDLAEQLRWLNIYLENHTIELT